MKPSQARSIKKRLTEVIASVRLEHPADQISARVTNHRIEDGNLFVDVEVSIINPDQDYGSGWYWVDDIGVGPRGRII